MDTIGKASKALATSFSKRPSTSSERPEMADRMTISEATAAASRLTGQWPNGKPDDPKRYLGGLASIMTQYPRPVIEKCLDPFRGLARKLKFLPTPSDLIAWCDEEARYFELRLENADPTPLIIYPIGGVPSDGNVPIGKGESSVRFLASTPRLLLEDRTADHSAKREAALAQPAPQTDAAE